MANRTFNNVKMNVTLKTQSTRANLLSTSEDIAVQMGKIQKWYTDFAWSAFTAPTVTVTGSGNAVTTASFNTSTGLLTLTKGKTFVTNAESRVLLNDLLTGTEFIDAARKDTHIDVAANALSGAPKAVGIYAIGMRPKTNLTLDDVTDLRIIGDRDHLLYNVGYLSKDDYVQYTDFASLLTPADVTGTSGITITTINSNTSSTKVRPITTYPCAVQIGHSNSITAGTASGSATKTLTFGDTFDIPTVTYDAQGHITATGVTTMTMPDNPDTDTKVNQKQSTSNSYRALLMGARESTSDQTLNTETTAGSYVNANLVCVPNTGRILSKTGLGCKTTRTVNGSTVNYTYGMIHDNGTNMWIGSTASNTTHHPGSTYISTGYDIANSVGNPTLFAAVPTATNTDSNLYEIWHRGYNYHVIPNTVTNTWEDVGIPLSTATTFKIVREGTGSGATPPPNWAGGSNYTYGSGIAIGSSDTAALISFRSRKGNKIPSITFAAGGRTGEDAQQIPYNKPEWYMTITGANEATYDLSNLQASSLSTNAGDYITPVYFSNGIPVACTKPSSGACWPGVAYVKTDGTMDIGRYIDFHHASTDTSNYYYRLYTYSGGLSAITSQTNNLFTIESGGYNQIRFKTTATNKAYTAEGIRVYPLTTSGATALIDFGGNVVIGGGDFAEKAYSRKDSTGTTQVGYDNIVTTDNASMYLGSINDLHIITNANSINTYNNFNYKAWKFLATGRLNIPGPIQSLPDDPTNNTGISPMLIQNTKSASAFVNAVRWLVGGEYMGTYGGGIGFHNTGGDSTDKGAIVMIPYPTDASPWDRGVGLYLGKNILKLDGVDVPRVTQSWTEAMIATLPAGTSNPLDTSNLVMESITTPGLYNRKPALMFYKYMNDRGFAAYYNGDQSWASNSWCKLAELSVTTTSTHRGNVFIVSENFGSSTTNYRAWGILAFAGSTSSSGLYTSATLQWLVASPGIKKDCFALTYSTIVPTFDTSKYYWTASSGGTQVTSQPANWETNFTDYYVSSTSSGSRSKVTGGTKYQIWGRCYVRYNGWVLKSLVGAGTSISTSNYDWVYYRSTGSSGVADYEGTLVMYSQVSGILNYPTQENAIVENADPQPLIYSSATNNAPPIQIEVSGLFNNWRLVLMVCKQFLYTSSSGASLSALIPLERVKKLGTSPGANVFKIPLPYTATNNTKGLNSITITYVNDNKFTVGVDLESGRSSIGAGEYKLYGIY